MAARELPAERASVTRAWLNRLAALVGAAVRPVAETRAAQPHLDETMLEACRLLRANLSPGQVGNAPPRLLILGVRSDPGCALLAAGLAATLAEEGPTLLVDADMRHPMLHDLFDVGLSPGLGNELEHPSALVALSPVGTNLWLLPAGNTPRSPAELLRLPALSDLTQQLANEFQAVVYHISGDAPYSDALLLAASVRSAILVVRARRDSARQVVAARQLLEGAGVNILGFTVLDGRDPPRLQKRSVSARSAEPSSERKTWRPDWLYLPFLLLVLLIGALLAPAVFPAHSAPSPQFHETTVPAPQPEPGADQVPVSAPQFADAPAATTIAPTVLVTSPVATINQPLARSFLDESFADNARQWPDDQHGTAWHDPSGYRVYARTAAQFVSIGAPNLEPLGDVMVSARFQKVGGPPGGGFGLLVRDQGPAPRDGKDQGGRYYVAAVSDTGDIGIWRREENRWVDLVPWQPDKAVHVGRAENELTLQAVGPRLVFLVNGKEVANIADDTLLTGGVGLFVGGDLNEVGVHRFMVQAPG